MTPSSVESVVNAVACCTHLDRDAEINLEANPTSTEIKKLRYSVDSFLYPALICQVHTIHILACVVLVYTPLLVTKMTI